jgi:twitching motility protein PilU
MQKSENIGMQTFDGALFRLVQAGKIALDEALKNADSPNNLRLRLNLDSSTAEKKTAGTLSLVEEKDDEDDAGQTALRA